MIGSLISFITEHGLELLLGATTILGLGCITLAFSRAPIHRQRLAELTIACFGLWLLVVLVPMPRLVSWRAPDRAPRLTFLAESVPEVAQPMHRPAKSPIVRQAGLTRIEKSVPTPITSAAWLRARSPRSISSQEPKQEPIEMGPWLATLFLGGSILMLACLGLGFVMLAVQLGRSRAAPTWLRCLGQRLLREAHASMRVNIRISARPTRPFCFGLGGGTIILPAEICARDKHNQLCGVLRHEIAHLHQRDTRGQLLFALALPVLFFHPLFWWLRHQSRLSAELIADDWAARQSDRISYARELITLSQQTLPGPAGLLPAMPVIASRTQFYRRMTMLLQREDDLATQCTPLRKRLQLSLAGLMVATGASLWGVEPLAAQNPAPRASRELQRALITRQVQVEKLQVQINNLQRMLEHVIQKNQAAAESSKLLQAMSELQSIAELLESGGGGLLGELIREGDELEAEDELEEIEEEEEQREIAERESEMIELRLEEIRKRSASAVDPENPLLRVFGIPTMPSEPTRVPTHVAIPSSQSDGLTAILDLLTRQIDLDAQRRGAELRLSELAKLTLKGMVGASELRSKRIEFESTNRKIELLRRVMKAEAKACAMELEDLHRRHSQEIKEGRSPVGIEAQMLRLQTRLELLKSVH